MRILRCVGIHQDDAHERLGITYIIPRLHPRPVTLREFIEGVFDRQLRPPLGDLFHLARSIVECVLELHKVGLVHKAISSHNIIIFCPEKSPKEEAMSVKEPYLIGFDRSRRGVVDTFTEGSDLNPALREYQHPEYLEDSHGFRFYHDYYSVGLILLELGRWKTVRKMTKELTANIWNRRTKLIKECDENLANTMGVYYRDAVRTCLTSSFTDKSNSDLLKEEFEVNVAHQLANCVA